MVTAPPVQEVGHDAVGSNHEILDELFGPVGLLRLDRHHGLAIEDRPRFQ
jgi:hypothetical protein